MKQTYFDQAQAAQRQGANATANKRIRSFTRYVPILALVAGCSASVTVGPQAPQAPQVINNSKTPYTCSAQVKNGDMPVYGDLKIVNGQVQDFKMRVPYVEKGYIEISYSDSYINDIVETAKTGFKSDGQALFIKGILSASIDSALAKLGDSEKPVGFECPLTPDAASSASAVVPVQSVSPMLPPTTAPVVVFTSPAPTAPAPATTIAPPIPTITATAPAPAFTASPPTIPGPAPTVTAHLTPFPKEIKGGSGSKLHPYLVYSSNVYSGNVSTVIVPVTFVVEGLGTTFFKIYFNAQQQLVKSKESNTLMELRGIIKQTLLRVASERHLSVSDTQLRDAMNQIAPALSKALEQIETSDPALAEYLRTH